MSSTMMPPEGMPPQSALGMDSAPPEPPQGPPMEEVGLDYEVAVGLVLRGLYSEKTMKDVVAALSEGDFVDASAVLLVDLVTATRDKMLEKDLIEDERVWAAQGGVIDTLADEFVEIGQQAGIEAAFEEGIDTALYERAIAFLEEGEAGAAQAPPEAMPPQSALGV